MASLAALSLGPEVTRVGLYFSGGWAKTAAKFTPVLEAWYAKNKSAQTALVLCSLDRDVRAYDTALATWPGQALPFGDDAVERFADALGVDGVPTLVWLAVGGGSAAAEYAVITAEGVEALAASPESAWPFGGGAAADGVAGASVDKTAEVGVWKILRGVTLSTAAGGTRTVAQLRASTDAVAFYFSAHWCPVSVRCAPFARRRTSGLLTCPLPLAALPRLHAPARRVVQGPRGGQRGGARGGVRQQRQVRGGVSRVPWGAALAGAAPLRPAGAGRAQLRVRRVGHPHAHHL
jgi:hypothetical protein